MLAIRSMASFIVNSKGLKMHDAIWDEVCTAMSVIEENLKAIE
jgi:hypothetical protein